MAETQGRISTKMDLKDTSHNDTGPVTEDAFLGGKLSVLQPRRGYRAGTDAVLLAASIAAHPGDSVLDIGAGVGVASLCLARRVGGLRITALELQSAYVDLLVQNCTRNRLNDQIEVVQGDILSPPREIKDRVWDHVMLNPPYYDRDKASLAAEPGKSIAHLNEDAKLTDWLDFALRRLKPKGTITIVHRSECLDNILVGLKDRAGGSKVLPVWPRQNRSAKRVIVSATKDSLSPLNVLPGIVMHEDGRRYSRLAEDILRRGDAINMQDQ